MVRLLFGKSKLAAAAVAVTALLAATGQVHAQVGYTLDVTTHYQAGDLSGPTTVLYPFNHPNPDTGYWIITNNGSSTFTGTVGQVTNGGGAANFNFTSGSITLAAGQSIAVAVNNESSNFGGFNNVGGGNPQNGVQININGLINGTENVNLSVFDKDIHSGVFRSANGHSSDSYVLQGGDPFGGDTGDGFEESQADGHFRFSESPPPGGGAAPEPASIAMLGMGALGMMGYVWRRKRQKTG